MKDYLKYATIILVAVAALVITYRIVGLFEPGPNYQGRIVTPVDPNFTPIQEKDYRPASTPFEKPSKPPVTLPKGVREKDVKQVISVLKKMPVASGDSVVVDTTYIVETKSGEIFIPRQSGKEISVEKYVYTAPIFSFDWYSSFGVSIGFPKDDVSFSPSLAVSPLEIAGTVQLPLMMTDLQGLGAGIGIHYSDFILGPVWHWHFGDAQRQYKFVVLYSIN